MVVLHALKTIIASKDISESPVEISEALRDLEKNY